MIDRISRIAAFAAAVLLCGLSVDARAQDPPHEGRADFDEIAGSGPNRRAGGSTRDFNELIRGSEKIEGLFTLHKKDSHLYAEIKPQAFDQPMLLETMIARGLAQAGMPVGDDDVVLMFNRQGDKIRLIRRNIHYSAPSGTPLDKSVKQNYVDSVLMSLPIVAINEAAGGAPVIDLSEIFLGDFAQLGLGQVDRSRSGWYRVKGYPNNLELEVELTFAGGGRFGGMMFGGTDGVADHRGITLVVHYSLMKAPDSGYHPRLADDRVGHFLAAGKDFGKTDPDTNFVRKVNRWRLEKADPKAALSPPKKQIVWYIEDTVPIEYRPFVESGIREWNKAFEKIGFVDAVAVRWQEAGRDDFDPEDTNYCTFRWVTSDAGFAMSCLRADPITGEMIDGDVVFDAGFIRYWKRDYAILIGSALAADPSERTAAPLAVGEVLSPILAARRGFGTPRLDGPAGLDLLKAPPGALLAAAVPSSLSGVQWRLGGRSDSPRSLCRFQSGLSRDFGLAAIAFALPLDTDDAKDKKDDKAKPPEPKNELPREFVGQAIKYITMHEVGHSLGLRHNFKASTMLPADQLNDTKITHEKGLVGSVMDYSPLNLAPKGTPQGDYYTTTLGPYDYWAIEYAYKPIDGDEAQELKKIACRSPEPGLAYATDEDMMINGDPGVNVWDLGSDTCKFARDRIELASNLMKELDAKVVKDGDSWARLRSAFRMLLSQWADGAVLASEYVGGQSVARDHKGDKGAKDPITPVPGVKQRECLKFLADEILSDKSFRFSPALLRRLGTEKWYHWGSSSGFGTGVDISVLETVLSTQEIVLGECLSPATLRRILNQQLQAEADAKPLKLEEVFRALTDGIWGNLAAKDDPAATSASGVIKRNLQREYLRRLMTLVLGSSNRALGDQFSYIMIVGGGGDAPADARSLARLHLEEIAAGIDQALKSGTAFDDSTKAHLKECKERIAKTLEAGLQVREP